MRDAEVVKTARRHGLGGDAAAETAVGGAAGGAARVVAAGVPGSEPWPCAGAAAPEGVRSAVDPMGTGSHALAVQHTRDAVVLEQGCEAAGRTSSTPAPRHEAIG